MWKLKGDEAAAEEGCCCGDGEGCERLCMSCMLGAVTAGECEGFREAGVYTIGDLTLDNRIGLVVLVSVLRLGEEEEEEEWTEVPHLVRKALR